MVREYGVYAVETKECLVQMNKAGESKIHAENYTLRSVEVKNVRWMSPKKTEILNVTAENTKSRLSSTVVLKYPDAELT